MQVLGCFLVAQGKLLLAFQALTYLLTDCSLKVAVLEPVPEDRAEFLHAILHGVARVEAEGCAYTPLYPEAYTPFYPLCPSTPLASAHITLTSHTHLTPLTPLTPLTNPHTPHTPHTPRRPTLPTYHPSRYAALASLGASPLRRVLTSGGGANNPQWMEMRQALLGAPAPAPSAEPAPAPRTRTRTEP